MRKLSVLIASLLLATGLTFGQLIDEKNVTITMDLQPVLQLHMTTPDYIDFTFDDIKDYYAGIIKYGATILKVSSSVSWDLYAVGTSTDGTYWDQQLAYSGGGAGNAVDQLPLTLLELHQYGANNYAQSASAVADYSTQFSPAQTTAPGLNTIYANANPYIPPSTYDKYIQGHSGPAPTDGAPGGSYLIATAGVGTFSDYYFVIDYRIWPGLPAIFPNAAHYDNTGALVNDDLVSVNGANAYARPGVYTMNVKYVLIEDQ